MSESATEIAVLGGGCFWCLEAVFLELKGVRRVTSGYMGGATQNPTYRDVCSGSTGHAEVIELEFDPAKIGFRDLLEVFFAIHDPTTLNRQGNDVGTQYRSIAFYSNETEKQLIDAELKKTADSKKYTGKIVTEVKVFSKFYPAEAYHQEYILHHPNQAYVANVSIPDYLRFRKEFKGKFKLL